MRRITILLTAALLVSMLCGCGSIPEAPQVAATTLPVYTFAAALCEGTDIAVTRLITQNVSCLHDYTLQVSQMRAIAQADLVILSGAGLEDFLSDALQSARAVCDASEGIELLCGGHDHDHDHSHSHESDPHIWLSPEHARSMAENICHALQNQYPGYAKQFESNLLALTENLQALQEYGNQQLSRLSCRELVTFHEGFAYFADSFGLTILETVEEESGSEASAQDLIALIRLVREHQLPAVFTEVNGSDAAASIIAAEAGISLYPLDMAMAGDDYFEAMYRNIDTLKEALQ